MGEYIDKFSNCIPITYTITYLVFSEGATTTLSVQVLNEGESSVLVQVPPDSFPSSIFKEWDDGNTSPTRTDIADSNKTFTAIFGDAF